MLRMCMRWYLALCTAYAFLLHSQMWVVHMARKRHISGREFAAAGFSTGFS
jgi:hypothetical protein